MKKTTPKKLKDKKRNDRIMELYNKMRAEGKKPYWCYIDIAPMAGVRISHDRVRQIIKKMGGENV